MRGLFRRGLNKRKLKRAQQKVWRGRSGTGRKAIAIEAPPTRTPPPGRSCPAPQARDGPARPQTEDRRHLVALGMRPTAIETGSIANSHPVTGNIAPHATRRPGNSPSAAGLSALSGIGQATAIETAPTRTGTPALGPSCPATSEGQPRAPSAAGLSALWASAQASDRHFETAPTANGHTSAGIIVLGSHEAERRRRTPCHSHLRRPGGVAPSQSFARQVQRIARAAFADVSLLGGAALLPLRPDARNAPPAAPVNTGRRPPRDSGVQRCRGPRARRDDQPSQRARIRKRANLRVAGDGPVDGAAVGMEIPDATTIGGRIACARRSEPRRRTLHRASEATLRLCRRGR